MTNYRNFVRAAVLATALLFAPSTPAQAQLVLSQLVVDIEPGKQARQDIEILNSGSEVAYVAVEPREIVNAGTPREEPRSDADPERLGLLVSPARMVLEPGQRKLIRVAAIAKAAERERVYRITVKPVVGELSSDQSGLKILVGYDVLVLVRAPTPRAHLAGSRSGDALLLRNDGNASVELTGGKQCLPSGEQCTDLPGGRIYVGATKTIKVDPRRRASWQLKVGEKFIQQEF